LALIATFGLVTVTLGFVAVWVTGLATGFAGAAKLGEAPARARNPVAMPSVVPSNVLVTTWCKLTLYIVSPETKMELTRHLQNA
jgi:hypothetical protein